MRSAATYNQQALGKIWGIHDLPDAFPGAQLLVEDHIDWEAFSKAVEDFQAKTGIAPQDAKLGPVTLRRLQASYGAAPAASGCLTRLGDLILKPATVPESPPPGPPLEGRTPAEHSLCRLWNRYGAAILSQAQAFELQVETALAVFFVESGTAYDPGTGLVIIRFEPAVFRRRTGQSVPYNRGGQQREWDNLARAYGMESEAALWSTSYGLPQLMGFNWQVTRHGSLREMVLAFQDSCVEQVAGFFGFVETNGLVRYLKKADWREFTRRYNGPGNVAAYSSRLINALNVAQALKVAGARFVA